MLRRTKEERKADLQLPPIKATVPKSATGGHGDAKGKMSHFPCWLKMGYMWDNVGIANLDGFKLDG